MTVARDLPGIAGLLAEGIRSTFSDRRGLLLYGVLATLGLTVAWSIGDLTEFLGSEMLSPAIEFGLVFLAFQWQRRYLVGAEWEGWGGLDEDAKKDVYRLLFVYEMRGLLLYGSIAIVAVAVVFPFLSDHPDVAVILTVPVILVLFVATARFLLVFPAYASGKRLRWLESWNLSRGCGLRLGSAVVLTHLPVVAILSTSIFVLPISFQESATGVIVINLLFAATRILGMLVALNATAYLYKRLTEPVDASAFD